jgi:hypothetical protein
MSYGAALAQKGKADEALSEFLWCFDHGLEHSRGFVGVRLSFLLSRIVQLGRTHPAALEELRKRRDSAAKALEARKANVGTAKDVTALNSNLGEPEQTLVLFDRIKADKSQPPMMRRYILDQALDQLLKAKRRARRRSPRTHDVALGPERSVLVLAASKGPAETEFDRQLRTYRLTRRFAHGMLRRLAVAIPRPGVEPGLAASKTAVRPTHSQGFSQSMPLPGVEPGLQP